MKEVSSLEMQFHNKYYCLAAANALLKYIECHLNHGFNRASLKIEYQAADQVSSLELQFHNKYYCLAAANALLKYIECHLNHGFNRASLKIEYQAADQVTVIAPATAE